jgi:hypothetical protein
MPEVILCIYCVKPIDKTKDECVLIRKSTQVSPEALAHIACQQNRPKENGIAEALTRLRERLGIKW